MPSKTLFSAVVVLSAGASGGRLYFIKFLYTAITKPPWYKIFLPTATNIPDTEKFKPLIHYFRAWQAYILPLTLSFISTYTT